MQPLYPVTHATPVSGNPFCLSDLYFNAWAYACALSMLVGSTVHVDLPTLLAKMPSSNGFESCVVVCCGSVSFSLCSSVRLRLEARLH